MLEHRLNAVARAWLDARRGLQVFVAHVDLFHPRALRRWFYATCNGRVVGVQSLVQLDAYDGYLFEHLLTVPDVPAGTAELLVAAALDALGAERVPYATFGVSTAAALGHMSGLSPQLDLARPLVLRSTRSAASASTRSAASAASSARSPSSRATSSSARRGSARSRCSR